MAQAESQIGSSYEDVLANYRQLTAMQELVSGLSRNLVHCPAQGVRAAIDDALAQLGAFVDADRVYVFEYTPHDLISNTHEWCAEDVKPEIAILQNLPRSIFDFWITFLIKGQAIHVPDVMALGDERAFEKEILANQGIQSLLVVPMMTSENLLGFIGFDSVHAHRIYLAGEVSLLKWVADLVSAALLRERDAQRMMIAEAELNAEKERFRIIADTVSDVLWDYDLAKQTWWITQDWPGKLGISDHISDSGEARSWFDRVLPEDNPKLKASFRELLKSASDNWEIVYRFRGNDDELIDVLVKATVLRGPDGRVLRMLGNSRNITQEKRNQEVYTRSRALEAVGQLTGGVAHDFNNLLMIILGNAELLETSGLDEDQAESVAMIHQASSSAADLTRRLLSFSRQSQLQTGCVDLTKVVPNTVALLRAGIPESIVIRCDVEPGIWPANADANALEQAIVNLAVNSRDAMPNGGEIVIGCENLTIPAQVQSYPSDLRAGNYVVVAVTDTGKGMSGEVLAKACEPFFTTKDVGKGSGLGLSTVYGFAKQSGGQMTIHSEPGHGTTVKIYLPRFRKVKAEQQASLETKEAGPGTGQRILVVEDDPQVRAHVQKRLAKLGYNAIAVANAQEALSLLHDGEEFDLLFTDVIMPGGMNGQQLGQAALKLAPQIKVLHTSGYPAAAFEHLGLEELSSLNFLSKPYRSSQLQEKLAAILDD
jgi:signal transduction histidine kinase/ActR/RegA family two-component response regulator